MIRICWCSKLFTPSNSLLLGPLCTRTGNSSPPALNSAMVAARRRFGRTR